MDLPVDGRRPGEEQRARARTVRRAGPPGRRRRPRAEALADQVRMAEAARRIVRRPAPSSASSGSSPTAGSADRGLPRRPACGCRRSIPTTRRRSGAIYSADGSDSSSPPTSSRSPSGRPAGPGSRQEVGDRRPRPPFGDVDQRPGPLILATCGIGITRSCSPRSAPARSASATWCSPAPPPGRRGPGRGDAGRDIGHDLGRAIMHARTFEREHQLVQELQALDAYKSQLIATVAHELKSPLTSVLGSPRAGGVRPHAQRRGQELGVRDAARAHRLATIIDDLLRSRRSRHRPPRCRRPRRAAPGGRRRHRPLQRRGAQQGVDLRLERPRRAGGGARRRTCSTACSEPRQQRRQVQPRRRRGVVSVAPPAPTTPARSCSRSPTRGSGSPRPTSTRCSPSSSAPPTRAVAEPGTGLGLAICAGSSPATTVGSRSSPRSARAALPRASCPPPDPAP